MSKFLQFSLFLFIGVSSIHTRGYSGYDPWKDTCTMSGRTKLDWCKFWNGLKVLWRTNSIAFGPAKTKNMTFTELKYHCDDYFVCVENSGCYKDFFNYQELDSCIENAFYLGPMGYCEETLREVAKNSPDQVSECVKEHLNDKNPEKFDCQSIYDKGKCFLPDVKKHCDPNFFPIFKERNSLRMYNRACDGRLRYHDWDYAGGQDVALQFTPMGIKVAEAKRNITFISDYDDGNSTSV